jgi:hypothetical protein
VAQDNSLKGIDKKTVRREGIGLIKKVFLYVLFTLGRSQIGISHSSTVDLSI